MLPCERTIHVRALLLAHTISVRCTAVCGEKSARPRKLRPLRICALRSQAMHRGARSNSGSPSCGYECFVTCQENSTRDVRNPKIRLTYVGRCGETGDDYARAIVCRARRLVAAGVARVPSQTRWPRVELGVDRRFEPGRPIASDHSGWGRAQSFRWAPVCRRAGIEDVLGDVRENHMPA
jgi:hypothetical protein